MIVAMLGIKQYQTILLLLLLFFFFVIEEFREDCAQFFGIFRAWIVCSSTTIGLGC